MFDSLLSKEAQCSTDSHYSFLPPSITFGRYSLQKPSFLKYEFFYVNLLQAYRKVNFGGD